MIKAKPILKNKFWIIESNGKRIGTLSKEDDKRLMYSCRQVLNTLVTQNNLMLI